jgi:hypothetical protein
LIGRRRLTRRQVIRGLVAAGVAGIGVVVFGLDRVFNPSSVRTAGSPPAGDSPSAGAPLTAAASPTAAGSAPASSGPRHAFRSRPELTPPVVTVSAGSAGDSSEGLVFLTPGNGAGVDGPFIVDTTGEPVWVGPDTEATVTGLSVVELDGAPALCWWEGTNNNGIGSGEFVYADTSYREIRRLTGANGAKTDLHELLMTSRGTALLFVAVPIKRDRSGKTLRWPVMDGIVQELDLATGALVFEWHAADHIDLAESFAAAPTKADAVYDYIHANAIDIDLDGNLLVSARNTSTIYKVDRGSGQVIWRMGGKRSDFAVAENAAFGWQHDVRRHPDGTLTIFDNAHSSSDDQTGHPSRAIVVQPDMSAMTVALVREYRHPSPLIASSQGDVQLLPGGDVFVGWGSTPWFSQFKASGETVLDATFPASKQSYRCLRFAWSGRPVEPPAIALERLAAGFLAVYASWNGHTAVETWEVLAGPSASRLKVVATTARSGFETMIPARTVERLVTVRARDASGAVLGTAVPVANPA